MQWDGDGALEKAKQDDEILVQQGVFQNEIVGTPKQAGRIPSVPCDGKG